MVRHVEIKSHAEVTQTKQVSWLYIPVRDAVQGRTSEFYWLQNNHSFYGSVTFNKPQRSGKVLVESNNQKQGLVSNEQQSNDMKEPYKGNITVTR